MLHNDFMKEITAGSFRKEYVKRPEGLSLSGVIRPRFVNYHRLIVNEDLEYPAHIHDEYELIWVENGPYRCSLNGQELTLQNEEVLVIKPGDHHQDHLHRGQSHFVLHFTLKDPLFAPRILPESQIGTGRLRNAVFLFREMERESSTGQGSDRFSGSLQDALMETLF